MEAKANKLFEDAIEKLNEANEELLKPKEDVVSFVVCKNAQSAIENYLKGFLFQKGIDANQFNTIERLHQQCNKINENFKRINFSGFDCKFQEIDSRYCDDVSKVSSCYKVADSLDTLMRREKIIY